MRLFRSRFRTRNCVHFFGELTAGPRSKLKLDFVALS